MRIYPLNKTESLNACCQSPKVYEFPYNNQSNGDQIKLMFKGTRNYATYAFSEKEILNSPKLKTLCMVLIAYAEGDELKDQKEKEIA